MKSVLLQVLWAGLIPCFSFAQGSGRDYIISGGGHYGFLIAHHGSMQYLVNEHIYGAELNFTLPTHGKKRWERIYHYPEMGLSFLYLHLGDPQTLGSGMGLYPYINLPLARGKKSRLNLRLSQTVGYITKKFDRLENHKDVAIGSHFNMTINIRFNAQFQLSRTLLLETGIGLTHFSNGAAVLPNAGINIPTLTLGLGYHFNEGKTPLLPDTFSVPSNRTRFVSYAAIGFCSIDPPGSRKYPAFITSFNIERLRGNKNHWNTGIELAYDASNIPYYKSDTLVQLDNNVQNLQVGYKVGYATAVGNLCFPVEMGVYLYSNSPLGHFFHRIGLRYQINERWIACLTLKTHWANAEFFEWGVGYCIPVKRSTKYNVPSTKTNE